MLSNPANFQRFYLDIASCHLKEQVTEKMSRDGFITFDGIHSPEALLSFCKRLGKIVMHRDADKNGITKIVQFEEGSVRPGYQAFTADHLSLHTDGSSVPEPATFVVLWCARPANTGGLSLFVDGKCLYHSLATHSPQILSALSIPGSAFFTGAEQPLYSAIFSTTTEHNVCIRFRSDHLGRYAPVVRELLPTFLDILGQHTLAFALQEHQGYLLQNGRWLHGRTAFQGEREMYRVLLQPQREGLFGREFCLGFSPD